MSTPLVGGAVTAPRYTGARRQTGRCTPIYPRRSYAQGAHGQLPAARAWRILARPAAEYAAGAPSVMLGAAPVAPAGCLDGVYPVWVRCTDPDGRSSDGELLLVVDDRWHFSPTGVGWRLEVVAGGAADTDRFAFVVETVETTAEAGWR